MGLRRDGNRTYMSYAKFGGNARDEDLTYISVQ